jgi:hypothetical protein
MSRLTYGKHLRWESISRRDLHCFSFNSELKDIDVSPHLGSQRMISRPIGGSIRKRASTVNPFRTLWINRLHAAINNAKAVWRLWKLSEKAVNEPARSSLP